MNSFKVNFLSTPLTSSNILDKKKPLIGQENWSSNEKNLSANFPKYLIDDDLSPGMIVNKVNYDEDKLISVSIKVHSDWSFKTMSQQYLSKAMNKEGIENLIKVKYNNSSVNLYESEFPIKLGNVVHTVYSGVEKDTDISMTVAVLSFIKNGELYTVNAQCRSTYFDKFYRDCIAFFDSLTFINN